MSSSLRPHGPQHTRSPCPSPAPIYSDSCPLSRTSMYQFWGWQLNPENCYSCHNILLGPCHDPNIQLGTGNTRHIQSVPYRDWELHIVNSSASWPLFPVGLIVVHLNTGVKHALSWPWRGATMDFPDPRSWFLLCSVTCVIHWVATFLMQCV